MSSFDGARAESLANQLLSSATTADAGELMNGLLSEFHRGYQLENLRPFLHSDNLDVLRAGAWIASELGQSGSPLLGDVVPLLGHPDRRVRVYALDCLLLWANSSQGQVIASTLAFLDDSDDRIRRKEMDFLSRASEEQLAAAMLFVTKSNPQSKYKSGLDLLLGKDNLSAMAIAAIGSGNVTLMKFGAVLARRTRRLSLDPLKLALSSINDDVKLFAESSMRII